jgi:hypothetical protein
MRPWTKRDGADPWSMVDQASYPFRGSNLGRPSGFRRLRENGDEATAAKGGAAVEPPESHRNGALVHQSSL